MRQRFFNSGLIAAVLFAFAIVGCSDDKSTNSGSGGGLGLNEDQTSMQNELDAASDSLVVFLADAFESRASLGVGGDIDPVFYTPIDNDSDVVASSYDTTNGWHQVIVTRIATAYNMARRDSIQFRDANGDFQRQGGSAHFMTYHHRFTRETLDTTTEYYNRSGVWAYELSGLQTNQATIDGTTEITTAIKYVNEADSTTIWRTYTLDATVSNLTVNRVFGEWTSICPSSGTISGTMTTTYKRGDNEMISRTWDVTVNFTDGTATINVTFGNREWEGDRSVCTVVN
jgi:hypothetical protein